MGGGTLEGLVLNQSATDMQLLGDDRKIHLLRKTGDRYRGVTSQSDWLSYNGETTGSRYSPLTQINKGNAGKMAPKWIFSLPNTSRLQVTPVVAGGVMYVTAEAGKGFMGGSFRQAPDEPAQRILRAIDIHTGKAVWGLPQTGAVNSWGGVLSTSGGVVIFGEDSGALMAADAASGKPLWSFQTSQLWKASPMTYLFDNTQYVAVAAGSNIIAFGLPE